MSDNAERMISGKEEGNSSGENRADKGINITSLVVSSRTTTQIPSALISSSCVQDLCLSTHGSGGPGWLRHFLFMLVGLLL